MNEVIIVGAGGFGRTIYWQCVGDYGYQRHRTLAGTRSCTGLRTIYPLP